MSKFDKFKEILAVAGPMAKPFIPGAAGTALDAVTKAMDSHSDAATSLTAAVTKVAEDNDEQTRAILALHERVKALESR